MLFLNQKYIYEILIGSCEKAKVPCTGQPTSARSIYSWSRITPYVRLWKVTNSEQTWRTTNLHNERVCQIEFGLEPDDRKECSGRNVSEETDFVNLLHEGIDLEPRGNADRNSGLCLDNENCFVYGSVWLHRPGVDLEAVVRIGLK